MAAEITISTRALGRRKRLLDDWSIPFPPEFSGGGEPLTLRELIVAAAKTHAEKLIEEKTGKGYEESSE